MITRRLLIASLCSVSGTVAALAQGKQPTPPNTNGWQEIIRAGERLRGAKAILPRPFDTDLSKKRAYLAHPACRVALLLFRQGIGKSLGSLPVASNVAPLYGTFALLRALARLIAVRVAVGFADDESAVVMRDVTGLQRVCDAFAAQSFDALMAAYDMEKIVLKPLLKSRDSWSGQDCEQLIEAMKPRLIAPDPAMQSLVSERAFTQRLATRLKSDSNALEEHWNFMRTASFDSGQPMHEDDYAKTLKSNAAVRKRVWGELSGAINDYYKRLLPLLQKPTTRLALPATGMERAKYYVITLYLRDSLVPPAEVAVRQAVEYRILPRFLAVHAAIHAHRMENGRLPGTLGALQLPTNITTDPFTAKPLIYEPNEAETDYVLASAGTLLTGTSGEPDTRTRFVFPAEVSLSRAPTAAR